MDEWVRQNNLTEYFSLKLYVTSLNEVRRITKLFKETDGFHNEAFCSITLDFDFLTRDGYDYESFIKRGIPKPRFTVKYDRFGLVSLRRFFEFYGG